MIGSQQFPWLSHQIVLMELDLIRAARRKRTVYGEKRPEAAVGTTSQVDLLGSPRAFAPEMDLSGHALAHLIGPGSVIRA